MAPVTGDAASEYEGDRLMKVVPLQRTRLRCVVPVLTMAAAYAVAARLGYGLLSRPAMRQRFGRLLA